MVSENFSRGPIDDMRFTAKKNELQICRKSFEMKQFLNRCLVGVVYLENVAKLIDNLDNTEKESCVDGKKTDHIDAR